MTDMGVGVTWGKTKIDFILKIFQNYMYYIKNVMCTKICMNIELSNRQWFCLEDKLLLLSNMTIISGKNPKVQYNQIKLGKDLKLKKKSGESSAKHIIWKTPTLENILGGYILIFGKKK